MDAIFEVNEQAKATELVVRLIEISPAPTKIEITKSQRGLCLTTFPLIAEGIITKS